MLSHNKTQDIPRTSWAGPRPPSHILGKQRLLWRKHRRRAKKNHTGMVLVDLCRYRFEIRLDCLWGYSKGKGSSLGRGLLAHRRTLVFLFLHLAHTLEECRPEAASCISGMLLICICSEWRLYLIRLSGILTLGVVDDEALAWRGAAWAVWCSYSAADHTRNEQGIYLMGGALFLSHYPAVR